MVFNSLEYLLFLPIVFLLYWLVFKTVRSRNLFIIAASYLFYGWWSWKFLILIFITTLCSYLSGIAIEKSVSRVSRRGFLIANIVLNLGILFTYKYFNFFAASFAQLFRAFGMTADDVTLNLILPVGISFYTFQALSYSIDVYRREIKATRDVAAFFSFISFFPQLVAGPIERATNLLPQFLKNRTFDYSVAVEGMKLILWGLFKKVLVADNCARVVNLVFAYYTDLGALNLWEGAILFTFQIYGDFSGYSDIAIGSAKLFGINLMRNFDRPYFSKSIPEFWQRWHISLQSWFRDYIYIPLGGSRKGRTKTARNTAVVFLISGLWHGANWTFIAWGLYHALLFTPKFLQNKDKRTELTDSKLKPFRESTAMAATFMLVVVGWVIFRSDTLSDAIHYIGGMFTDWRYVGPFEGRLAVVSILLLVFGELISRGRPQPFNFPAKGIFSYRMVRWIIYIFVYTLTITMSGNK
ncbi:MAG: MBOAT family protein, partial [Muribaculaceae bacterium]|nr:MBOAT family protein [Muribaculaceae bacterium]